MFRTISKSNGFTTTFIRHINRQIQRNINNKDDTHKNETHIRKIRTTFTYFRPLIRKITNLFKHTNIQIAVKTINTIQQLTQYTSHQNTAEYEKPGIYKLTCNTCNLSYIGQTHRSLQPRYKEHTRYIQYNDTQSAYTPHILNNTHEYGRLTDTMKLIKYINNPTMLLPYEQLFMQSYHHHEHLILE